MKKQPSAVVNPANQSIFDITLFSTKGLGMCIILFLKAACN
jgi:hypothetical protein